MLDAQFTPEQIYNVIMNLGTEDPGENIDLAIKSFGYAPVCWRAVEAARLRGAEPHEVVEALSDWFAHDVPPPEMPGDRVAVASVRGVFEAIAAGRLRIESTDDVCLIEGFIDGVLAGDDEATSPHIFAAAELLRARTYIDHAGTNPLTGNDVDPWLYVGQSVRWLTVRIVLMGGPELAAEMVRIIEKCGAAHA